MIFLGDIALPDNIKPNITRLPFGFKNIVVANLEGPIVPDNSSQIKDKKLFNGDNIFDLLKDLNIKVVSLANNHIFDYPNYYQNTINKLLLNDIKFTGAGENLEEASKPAIVVENGQEYALLSFGWDVIKCTYATDNSLGVNPLEIDSVTKGIKKTKIEYPDAKIIILNHWNYELEVYPQPMHRKLAQISIDLGVEAVIGHHSHCVQGIEIYKGKPIIYGLGNWYIPDGVFFNGKLKYPQISKKQIAVEIDEDKLIVHEFEYNPLNNSIEYKQTSKIEECEMIKNLTPFNGMNHEEYYRWFRVNRRKKRGLPIFYDYDKRMKNIFYKEMIKLRQNGIELLLKFRLKNGPS